MQTRPIVSHLVTFGDSLTDRKTMYKRTLFGIPLRYIIGLDKTSPKGRFTNGYTWDDDLGTMLANMLIAKEYEKKCPSAELSASTSAAAAAAVATPKQITLRASDIADDIINHDSAITDQVNESYSLNDDKLIQYKGTDFLRSHAEGGLTAHDYSASILSFKAPTREIVSTLAAKREELLAEDAKRNTSPTEKSQTLVIELSGANDMITVNDRPTQEIVNKAIAARIENVKELIKHGYKNFVLINLPDLSLTPSCQSWSEADKRNMSECIDSFNKQLKAACEQLRRDNPNAIINCFDLHEIFNDIIKNPDKYGLDKNKQSQPFIKSPDFKIENGVSHAPGYTFWDDLHPTAHVHCVIADKFYSTFNDQFNIQPPSTCVVNTCQTLCEAFMKAYVAKLETDKHGFFGNYIKSNLHEAFLENRTYLENKCDYIEEIMVILGHALSKGGARTRTRSVLLELGWINDNNNINVFIPALAEAKRRMDYDIDKTTSTHSLRYKQ